MNAHPIEQLSEYVDDELSPPERARIEAHLSDCPSCARLVDDLRAVVAAARSVEDVPPARDLWPGIADRIERRSGGPTIVPIESRREPRRFSFSVPQLAAASIAIALLSAGAVWMAIRDSGSALGPTASAPRSEEPITGAVEEPISGMGEETAPAVTVADRRAPGETPEYEAAVAELERLLDEAAIDPELRKAIDENLAIIDDAIRQTRRALEEDPDDVYLNTHLASTMQHKIDVLQDAARLARAST
ncbi:MAG TPA: zf-HC2 domain-containing protein [Gemmatimonadota bacterium]|jgi:anti-sigma factor ChrR (cupin superfamily)|nr:zf-HC2 domain-containing protein [Gemmatimonadota bacterium]